MCLINNDAGEFDFGVSLK